MINWTIVASAILGMVIYDICDAIASYIIKKSTKRTKKNDQVKRIACIDCEYFNDSAYYTDNTINISSVAWGSCNKCQCNITSSNPCTEIPRWCPIKENKLEERNGIHEN